MAAATTTSSKSATTTSSKSATATSSKSNPLQEWREKATFDVDALGNLVFSEEIVQFRKQVWDTLAKDPLFSDPNKELTLHEKRELSFMRLKRLIEYEFLTDEDILACPIKPSAFLAAILPLDTSAIISWQLSNEVRSSLVTCSHTICQTEGGKYSNSSGKGSCFHETVHAAYSVVRLLEECSN